MSKPVSLSFPPPLQLLALLMLLRRADPSLAAFLALTVLTKLEIIAGTNCTHVNKRSKYPLFCGEHEEGFVEGLVHTVCGRVV